MRLLTDERAVRLRKGLANRGRRARLRVRRAFAPTVPFPDVHVRVDGPAWLVEMLRPSVGSIATGADASSGDGRTVVVASLEAIDVNGRGEASDALTLRSDDGTLLAKSHGPLIQPRRANPLNGALLRLPAPYQQSARDGARQVPEGRPPRGRADPATVTRWLDATAAAHARYRAAHRQSVDNLLREATPREGDDSPLDDVAVVCVTNRPPMLANIIENYRRQQIPARLYVVTNHDGFDRREVTRMLEPLAGRAMHLEESLSLGRCLNVALDAIGSRYVAKFDDDDHYGQYFLEDLLIAHRYADAGVVGKHSYFARVIETDHLVLRHPCREFEYTSFLAGGTLLIDRAKVPDVRFPDQSRGEDQEFLRRCERAGHGAFAADRFNYVQTRTRPGSWYIDDESFARRSLHIGAGTRTEAVAR